MSSRERDASSGRCVRDLDCRDRRVDAVQAVARPVQTHSHAHPHHDHDHSHDHGHDHHPDHDHEHSHGHSHMPEEISWSGLAALGASGGLVPCESALVLLLTAVALGRVALGLLLLVSFSFGLGDRADGDRRAGDLRQESVARRAGGAAIRSSAGCRWPRPRSWWLLGVVMTGVSLGWIQPIVDRGLSAVRLFLQHFANHIL